MDDLFQSVDGLLSGGRPVSSLEYLIEEFRREKNYPAVFEARLMKCRHELGLPVIQTESFSSFPAEQRQEYETTFLDAAREVAEAYLADGRIERAWPYFRAIGETGPVFAAIDRLAPAEGQEDVIGIAFQEGLHPRKGLELMLAQHGMCRAITAFGMYAVEKDRQACIALLLGHLHAEIVERMKRAIEAVEGRPPETESIETLIAGRDWMFGEYDTYIDTSHVMSVLQYAPELTAEAALRQARELCIYGRRLSPQMQLRGQYPFEDTFNDYGAYIDALLGVDCVGALDYFRKKIAESDLEEYGTGLVQAFVRLLVRLERFEEAIDLSLEFLSDLRVSELSCPAAMDICRMAGDYDRLMEIAKQRGDLLSYTAAALERARNAT
ncbi:MAG: hypothetical protein IT168_05165 [Bryobacterales bacterium]|nr:hypothetical protein [Bryobacterales bacterium]